MLGLALASAMLWQSAGAQEKDIPPDASHLPDVETEDEDEPSASKPEIPDLPSWGNDDPKLTPRLWPGNPGSPSNPATTFTPELQLPPEVDRSLIPDLYLSDYFGTLPESYLLDPQTLLTAHERTSVNRALKQHATESGFPVYILLFEKEQKIPEFQNLEALQIRWFGDRPGVVVGFWLGSPTRTAAYFGHTLRKEYQTRLDDSFAEALGQSYKKTYPFSQLDHFTYTFLWRLGHLDETPPESPLSDPGNIALPTMPDFDPADISTTSWIPIAAGGSALALGVAALGASIIATRRKRERKQNRHVPIILPVKPAAERLGAPHSGGSGAMIKVAQPQPKIPSKT